MREVGSFDAKTHLPKLIDSVLSGERIAITRRGRPVAMLAPVATCFDDPRAAVERLKGLRRGVTWKSGDGMSIREAIDEGRR